MSDVVYDEHGCLYDRVKHDPDQPWSVFWLVLAATFGAVALIWGAASAILLAYETVLRMVGTT